MTQTLWRRHNIERLLYEPTLGKDVPYLRQRMLTTSNWLNFFYPCLPSQDMSNERAFCPIQPINGQDLGY